MEKEQGHQVFPARLLVYQVRVSDRVQKLGKKVFTCFKGTSHHVGLLAPLLMTPNVRTQTLTQHPEHPCFASAWSVIRWCQLLYNYQCILDFNWVWTL